MRRRTKRQPNLSEATGKIGQEIPTNQPAPLVPHYPDDQPSYRNAEPSPTRQSEPRHPEPRQSEPRAERAPRQQSRRTDWNEPASSGKLEVETQPEMHSAQPEASPGLSFQQSETLFVT